MTCPATLPGPSRLACTRSDPHTPHEGCVYRLPLMDDARHLDAKDDR